MSGEGVKRISPKSWGIDPTKPYLNRTVTLADDPEWTPQVERMPEPPRTPVWRVRVPYAGKVPHMRDWRHK
jgi:hypothetical protein